MSEFCSPGRMVYKVYIGEFSSRTVYLSSQALRYALLNALVRTSMHNVQGVYQPGLLKQRSSGSSLSLGHLLPFG